MNGRYGHLQQEQEMPANEQTRDRRENGREPGTGGPPAGLERRRMPAAGRRAWTPREAIVQRLRRPVIGLTLAGAAIPMAAATQLGGGTDEEAATEEADPLAHAATGENVEEELAERIGESEADRARTVAVESAMERYGIDRELSEKIHDVALEHNIEPRVAYGLIKTESTFRERAVSSVGARGLTQVMPRTAAWMEPGTRANDLFDVDTNLRLGFQYLSQMIDKYRGNVKLALLAYNRGPGTVDRVLKQGGDPDNGYADKVLRG
jgi:soluble lytic murein transglycosylase-like protein